MAWKATGTERGKSYQVYKDLESRYTEVAKERDDLLALIKVKDSTIRMLAAELAQVPGSDQAHQDAVKATIEAVERLSELRARSHIAASMTMPPPAHEPPPARSSGVVVRDVPLGQQIGLKKAGGK